MGAGGGRRDPGNPPAFRLFPLRAGSESTQLLAGRSPPDRAVDRSHSAARADARIGGRTSFRAAPAAFGRMGGRAGGSARPASALTCALSGSHPSWDLLKYLSAPRISPAPSHGAHGHSAAGRGPRVWARCQPPAPITPSKAGSSPLPGPGRTHLFRLCGGELVVGHLGGRFWLPLSFAGALSGKGELRPVQDPRSGSSQENQTL